MYPLLSSSWTGERLPSRIGRCADVLGPRKWRPRRRVATGAVARWRFRKQRPAPQREVRLIVLAHA
jgi:hypothetical protein